MWGVFVPFSLLGTVLVIALIVGAIAYIGLGIVTLVLLTLVLYQPFRLLKFIPRRQMRYWLSIVIAVAFWLVLATNMGDGGFKSYIGAAVVAGITLVLYWSIGLDPDSEEETPEATEDSNGDASVVEAEALLTSTAESDAGNQSGGEMQRHEKSAGAEGEPELKSRPEPTEATASVCEPKPAASESETGHARPTPPEPQGHPEIRTPSPRNKALDEAEAVRRAIFEATQGKGMFPDDMDA